MSEKQRHSRLGWRSVMTAAAAVTVIAGTAAVYEITSRADNGGGAQCAAATEATSNLKEHIGGEVAAVMIPDRPEPVPDLAFLDDNGNERNLSDWRGQLTLVNLWATWCAPCRYEMPALDNLQAELGSDAFEVVAINIDMGDDAKPRAFLEEIGATRLNYYADPTTGVFRELQSAGLALGMPTTLLIDSEGCELGHLAGPAEWDSPDAIELIEAALTED